MVLRRKLSSSKTSSRVSRGGKASDARTLDEASHAPSRVVHVAPSRALDSFRKTSMSSDVVSISFPSGTMSPPSRFKTRAFRERTVRFASPPLSNPGCSDQEHPFRKGGRIGRIFPWEVESNPFQKPTRRRFSAQKKAMARATAGERAHESGRNGRNRNEEDLRELHATRSWLCSSSDRELLLRRILTERVETVCFCTHVSHALRIGTLLDAKQGRERTERCLRIA